MNKLVKCKALLCCKPNFKQCQTEAITTVEGKPVCWVHKQAHGNKHRINELKFVNGVSGND